MALRRVSEGDAARQVAAWVEEFADSGYGPHAATKWVFGAVWPSPASALLEVGAVDAALRPYRDLARAGTRRGDQGTMSMLLASRLVKGCLDAPLAATQAVAGLEIARRQVRAVLHALARGHEGPLGDDPLWRSVWERLDAVVDLDLVELVVEDAPTAWLPGVRVPRRFTGAGKVALAATDRRPPKAVLLDVRQEDPASRAGRLAGLGVKLVVCGTALRGETEEALLAKQIAVWTEAPLSSLERLARATGAEIQPTLRGEGLGEAAFVRDKEGTQVVGSGFAATWRVQGHGDVRRDEAERILRQAGRLRADPRVLEAPFWIDSVVASLRAMQDLVSDRGPLAVAVAADAIASLRRDEESTLDGAALVEEGVDAAFRTAMQVLRIDARHDRRPSRTRTLRGGGRPGPASGLPGDEPPLM